MLNKCIVLIIGTTLVGALKLPSYINPCKADDPELNKCAKAETERVLPDIIKGDSKYGLPPLNPLTLPALELHPGSNLHMYFKNLNVNGFETAKFQAVDIDLEKMQWKAELTLDHLNLDGDYDIDGRLLVLPIKGSGKTAIGLQQPKFTYELNYELVGKEGKQHAKITSSKVTHVSQKVTYKFENLFNGDKRLGDEMNKFMNDNWEDVTKDLNPSFEDTVNNIVTGILQNLFNKIPYDNMFV